MNQFLSRQIPYNVEVETTSCERFRNDEKKQKPCINMGSTHKTYGTRLGHCTFDADHEFDCGGCKSVPILDKEGHELLSLPEPTNHL